MQQASRQFNAAQRKAVQQAVAEAESRTSAEIVPVVASVSGRYDRAEDMVGLWLGVLGLIAAWWLLPAASTESGNWAGMPEWQRVLLMAAATIVGFVLGAAVASYVGWLRLLFIPRRQLRDEVAARARTVFFDSRVHYTAGHTGLLIYVSLYERTAAILADQNVLDKLGQATLDALCATLTTSLRNSQPTDAICQTIRAAGDKLATILPRAENDINERPDSLVLLDR
jgi:putative membrane protein